MKKIIIVSLLLAALLAAGCSSNSGPGYTAQQSGTDSSVAGNSDQQISSMEADLQEMQSTLNDADFSGHEFLAVDNSTFQ